MTSKAVLRPLLLALSLSNLVFLRSWLELFRLREGEEAASPAARTLLWATLASILLLAGVLLIGRRLAQRWGGRAGLTAARCAVLFLVVTPIDFLDGQVRPLTDPWMPQWVYLTLWTCLLLAPVLAAVRLGVYGKPAAYRGIGSGLLVLSPLVVVLAANMIWACFGPVPVRAPEPLAGPVRNPAPGRVVWVVFDEFDYNLAYTSRPASIHLPELDRLRGEGFFSLAALPPARETAESMATYLLGRTVAKFDPKPNSFRALLNSGQTIDLKSGDNLMSEARRLGADTFLAGWFLPYREFLAGQLTECVQPTAASLRTKAFGASFLEQWTAQYREHWVAKRFSAGARYRSPWFGWAEREEQYLAYPVMLKESLRMAAGAGGRLVLLHFPIPHPLGIYNRYTNTLSLDTTNNTIDNLELVDRTVGDLRHTLEAAGLWDATTLIVTSDHPMRPDVWSKNDVWSEEERRLTGNRRHPYIPCLIKLAKVSRNLEFSKPFSTSALTALSLAFLRGQIKTVEEIGDFLSAPIPSILNGPGGRPAEGPGLKARNNRRQR
jgi:hypothetical protein